ncbi:WGxxGxxG family protein [Metabacillus idriensis]|uniref:WGxxGxxG family protein n=1 Tax=Metabacillus idriensis TaxID=324768 RepID=UPI002813A0CC|nr:WGxxGxxG family protein [Metabacillus idriensis]MDR0140197.1 WGxxGxxG family protein [Metabacillus idriensis]
MKKNISMVFCTMFLAVMVSGLNVQAENNYNDRDDNISTRNVNTETAAAADDDTDFGWIGLLGLAGLLGLRRKDRDHSNIR